MSYYSGEFFGGEFHSHYGEYVGVSVFFGGEFIDGGYFKPLEQTVKTGGKGDNPPIYKPTGLLDRKTPQQRVEETREIHREVRQTLKLPEKLKPIEIMTLSEIEAEIGERLRREDDAEIILMLLVAAAG